MKATPGVILSGASVGEGGATRSRRIPWKSPASRPQVYLSARKRYRGQVADSCTGFFDCAPPIDHRSSAQNDFGEKVAALVLRAKRFHNGFVLACMIVALLTVSTLAQNVPVNGLLTVAQAEELATKRKGNLSLNDLKDLPADVAAALAKQEGELSLDGLTSLTPEAAEALARHRPSTRFGAADLSLGGLTTLPPETTAALAKHPGTLALKSLTTLDSLPLARKLAAQWGELALNSLTTLSPEIAAILAENQGVLVDRTRPGVEQRRADRAPSILRFDSLTTLSAETASALAKQKGLLVLNGLSTLSPEVAAALEPHEGTLVLNGLTTLSPEAATALAASPGELVLRGVTTLSDPAGQALAQHKNRLYLPALSTASPAARLMLREHPKIRLPAGF